MRRLLQSVQRPVTRASVHLPHNADIVHGCDENYIERSRDLGVVFCLRPFHTLYPETGDFVAVFGNKVACFRIQSLLFREQVWTGLYASQTQDCKVV